MITTMQEEGAIGVLHERKIWLRYSANRGCEGLKSINIIMLTTTSHFREQQR